MSVGVLGPLEVDGDPAPFGLRDRVVLQALAVRPGTALSPEALAEALWGESPPPSWQKVLQGCVVRLRKRLGATAIETVPHGYRLVLHVDHLDHLRFERLVDRARELLATDEPERAGHVLGEALALWRGDPFVELADWDAGRIEGERLLELHREAEELSTEAALRAGRHDQALAPALRLVREAPFRERRWGLLALAQYQSGQQPEAVQTLRRARSVLVGELGLDPGPELVELEQAIRRQDPALVVRAALPDPSPVCPYPGLVAFDVADTHTFFGRERATQACLERLDDTGVLAIVGPSGSGKSSLARAGVAAALERDGRRVVVLTPGPHPLAALGTAPRDPATVLVIDQCEEALALGEDDPERTEFLAAVVDRAAHQPVVLTLRADRIGDAAAHPEFAHLLERGLHLLGAMEPADLRRAIEGPAQQAGLRLEPGLVDLLVHEVEGEPGALPLLSHVLRQTWGRREGQVLTVEGYTRSGGIRAAVAQSAESLFRDVPPAQQQALRELMLRLVAPDAAGDPVRTRLPHRAVVADPQRADLVERLVAARLLSTDGETVEIAHESLAVAWPRLRSWLDEDVEGLRTMRHLAVSAESWDELGRPDSELYRGVRQARAAEWRDRAAVNLTPAERDFLDASAALAEKEQEATEAQVRRERRLNQRLRLGLAAVAVLLAVALVAGSLALTAAQRADREAAVAAQQARSADARRLGAEALRSEDLDRSLLLAAAGLGLDDSVETRDYLLETLGRAPALVASTRRPGLPLGVAVDPGTGRVVSSTTKGSLQLHDGRTLQPVTQPARGTLAVGVVASPAGTGFAAAGLPSRVQDGQDPAVILLDPDGERSPVQLGGIPKGFHTFQELGFSPNGRWLSASLRPFDLNSGPVRTLVWDLRAPARPVATLALDASASPVASSDGRLLYTKSEDAVQVTDLPSGQLRRTVTAKDLAVRSLGDALVASPDGTMLALAAGDEAVILDRASLRPRAYVSGPGWTTGLAFSPDSTRLAASGDRLLVWDLTGTEPRELLVQDLPTDYPRFSPDGATVYSAHAGLFQAWDLTGRRRFVPDTTGADLGTEETTPRWTPDLTKVGYGIRGAGFRVRDGVTGELGRQVPVDMELRNVFDFAWHPDGSVLNVTSGDPVVRVWDAATGTELARHRLGATGPAGTTEGAAFAWFTSDGKALLVGSTTGRLHVLDARTLRPLRQPIDVYTLTDEKPREIAGFMPSADGHTVYLSDRVVDYVTGSVRPYPQLGYEFDDVFPSPDGTRLFVDAREGGTGVLDPTTMSWVSRPNPSQAGMVGWQGAFTDDGTLFASLGDDGNANLWDGRTGALLASMPMHADGAPAFSKDKKRLLVAEAGGSLLTWDLDPRSWVAAACRLAGRDLTEQEWRTFMPDRPFRRVCRS